MSIDKLWFNQLKTTLSKLLSQIIDSNDLPYYLDDVAMETWILAFTHETYSPSDNYEDLEFLGDAVLKSVFPKYLMKRFPELHKNDYTELNTRYMSKIEQGKLGYRMGFAKIKGVGNDLIRTKGVPFITINLVGDVFESFFGALDTISDDLGEGLGNVNSTRMIYYLFQNIEINDAESHAKTQVQQIFTRFELSKPLEISNEGKEIQIKFTPKMMEFVKQNNIRTPAVFVQSNTTEDAHKQVLKALKNFGLIEEIDKVQTQNKNNNNKEMQTFDIILTDRHLKFLQGYGINLGSNVIGHGEAPTKIEAGFKAYNDALSTLSNIRTERVTEGITTGWAEQNKLLLDIAHPSVKKYLDVVAKRLARDNFKSFYFATPAKTSDKKGAVIQLVGIREDGKKEVLSFTHVDQKDRKNGNIEARALIMQQYANSK